MTDLPSSFHPENRSLDTWPVDLDGVVETIISTKCSDGTYHHAAIGLRDGDGTAAAARTWGQTVTASNLSRSTSGTIQILADPLVFVEASLGTYQTPNPVLESANAWIRADAECINRGEEGGTKWTDWQFTPQSGDTVRQDIPVIRRGRAAVIEATVAASRLCVPSYDSDILLNRIEWCRSIVERCGCTRSEQAFLRLTELVDHSQIEPI